MALKTKMIVRLNGLLESPNDKVERRIKLRSKKYQLKF